MDVEFAQRRGRPSRTGSIALPRPSLPLLARLTFPRTVRIEEEESGAFAVRAGGQGAASGSPSLHVQIADGRIVAFELAATRNPVARQSRRTLPTSLAVPVPPARAPWPCVGIPRRDRACANRPVDPVESERRGVWLERANRSRQRAHPRDGRGHGARTRCAVPAGTQCARHPIHCGFDTCAGRKRRDGSDQGDG